MKHAQIICQGGTQPVANGEFIALFIDEICLDTSQFLSKDGFLFFVSKQREGVVKLNISGQSTVIPFFGEGKVLHKYLDKVAFLGAYCGWLSMDISLIELDEDTKKYIDNIQTGTNFISEISQPGSAILKNILGTIRNQLGDDEEAKAFLLHEEAILDGSTITLLFGDDHEKPLMKIVFRVESLGISQSSGVNMSVRVANPKLLFTDESQARCELNRKNMKIFNFEAASAEKRSIFTTEIERFFQTVTWQKNELFRVRASKVNHYLFPLFLNFSLNTQKLQVDSMYKSAQAAVGVLESFHFPVKTTKKFVKQMPTMLNLLSEVTQDNFSIFAFNGFVVLENKKNNGKKVKTCPGKIVLDWDSKQNIWLTKIKKSLTWRNNNFGSFEFFLEVREVPKY
ncbi:MAG: hypothetical protein KBC30_09210 [Planctomycetes bacterium]|nr:hypothetical protein [Planctomycetota bacterium]HPY74464.1 hypothetical protein [Planctomycetota bacterium]HQB00016.1 hypothetical protein [Planctomycetota bacterium]